MQAYKNKGFWIGVLTFSVIITAGIFGFIPSSLLELEGSSFQTNKGIQYIDSKSAWFVLAVLVLMAIWWATEAIPVAVSSLQPLGIN